MWLAVVDPWLNRSTVPADAIWFTGLVVTVVLLAIGDLAKAAEKWEFELPCM